MSVLSVISSAMTLLVCLCENAFYSHFKIYDKTLFFLTKYEIFLVHNVV